MGANPSDTDGSGKRVVNQFVPLLSAIMRFHALKRRLKALFRQRSPRAKALLWVTVISLFVGAVELGQPLEVVGSYSRSSMFNNSVSGDVVLVAIDNKSIGPGSTWPWSQANFAKLVEAVNNAGAEKIIVHHKFDVKPNEFEKNAFELVIQNVKSLSVSYTSTSTSAASKAENESNYKELFGPVDQVSSTVDKGFLGIISELQQAVHEDGRTRKSIATELASIRSANNKFFRIDYRFDPKTIPVFSAADVITGSVAKDALRNKRVLISATAPGIGKFIYIPRGGELPLGYIYILGAETLMKGSPIDLGWLPALLIAFFAAWASIRVRSSGHGVGICIGGVVFIIALPYASETYLIFMDIAPAIILLLGCMTANAWASFAKGRSHTNVSSGLPNIGALREQPRSNHAVVVATIRNIAEIQLVLDDKQQAIFTEQFIQRLFTLIGNRIVYHTSDGIFAWFANDEPNDPIGNQMDGLYRIFQNPVGSNDHNVDANLSIGVDTRTDLPISKRYDGARLAAMEAGTQGARWLSYEEDRHQDATWRVTVLGELENAIASDQLWVAYQPKVDVITRQTVGAEALIRWTHPTRGDIRPDSFIPFAEENGRMSGLTAFVLEQALRDAASIEVDGGPLPIAVNMSARSLEDDFVVGLVNSLLEKYNFPADRLTLELTESAAIRDGLVSESLFETLKGLGVRISIDDYGTGFSTLGYMKHIPSEEIKIDRSFVAALEKSHSDRLLVGSTIELAHSLGRKVVAEGVENELTAQLLQSLGCNALQGYLTGAPCEFTAFKNRHLDSKFRVAA